MKRNLLFVAMFLASPISVYAGEVELYERNEYSGLEQRLLTHAVHTSENKAYVSVTTAEGDFKYLATDVAMQEIHAKADRNSENISFVDGKTELYNKRQQEAQAAESLARSDGDKALEDKKLDKIAFDKQKAAQSALDGTQSAAIESNRITASNDTKRESVARIDADKAIMTVVDTKASTLYVNSENARQDAALKQTNGRVSNVEQGLKSLAAQTGQLRKHNAKGIAGVAAMNAIPQAIGVGKLNIGLGVGSFDNESVIAFGASVRVNENLSFKASASVSSDSSVYSVGAGYQFD